MPPIRAIYFDCGSLEELAKAPELIDLILRYKLRVKLSEEVFSETCNITKNPCKRWLFELMMEALRVVLNENQLDVLPPQMVALRIRNGITITPDIVQFCLPTEALDNIPNPQAALFLWQEAIKEVIRKPDLLPADIIEQSHAGAMKARKAIVERDSEVRHGGVLRSPRELMEDPDYARNQVHLNKQLLATYGIEQHRDSLPQIAMFTALFMRDYCNISEASKGESGQLSKTKAKKLPGAMDVAQMIYLPFTDAFVTDDENFKKYARAVASAMGHRCWIGTFERFQEMMRDARPISEGQ